MLTLSRRVGQVLTIGDDIEVRVVSMHAGKVKLAIEAPRGMTIRRQELPHHFSDHSGAPPSGDDRSNITGDRTITRTTVTAATTV